MTHSEKLARLKYLLDRRAKFGNDMLEVSMEIAKLSGKGIPTMSKEDIKKMSLAINNDERFKPILFSIEGWEVRSVLNLVDEYYLTISFSSLDYISAFGHFALNRISYDAFLDGEIPWSEVEARILSTFYKIPGHGFLEEKIVLKRGLGS